MKKVFLSLAVIATLTVVSCKDKEAAPAEETTTVETEVVAPEATTVDSTTVTVDSTTTTTTAPVQ